MAEINDFIDPKAEAQIQKYLQSLETIAVSYNKIFDSAVKVEQSITTTNKTVKDSTTKQTEANKAAQEASRIAKEQAAAVAALDKQRQAALQQIAKQEQKERELAAAMTMQVKSIKDAQTQNSALNEARKKLDLTTASGKKTLDQYNATINQNTKFIKENATAEGKRTGAIGLYQSAMLKSAAIIGAAVAVYGKLTSFFSDSVEAFEKGFKVTNQLNAVIKSTGGLAGRAAEDIKKQAKALNELTGVSTKQIIAGQSMLLTFTNIRGEIYDKAVPTMMDMATAMAAVNGSEIDLKSTSIQMGKALNDPIAGMNALKRVGVSFTEQQKEQMTQMVKSGNLVGAQTIILTELQTEFGGSAEAAGMAGMKSVNRLKQAWLNFQEPMGGFIVGIISPLADFGRVIIKSITPVKDLGDEMEKERQKVNGLAIALQTHNLPLEVKKNLMEQIRKISPNVVAGLNAEKLSLSLLTTQLEAYNQQQIKKIGLTRRDSQLETYQTKQSVLADEVAGISADISQGVTNMNAQIDKLDIATKRKRDIIEANYQKDKDLSKRTKALGHLLYTDSDDSQSAPFAPLLTQLDGKLKQLKTVSYITSTLQVNRAKYMANNGLTDSAPANSTAGADTEEQIAEKAAKAAEKQRIADEKALKVKQDKIDKENKIVADGMATDLKNFDNFNQTQLSKETELSDISISKEESRLRERANIEVKIIQQKVSSKKITEEEGEAEILALSLKNEKTISDLKVQMSKEASDKKIKADKEYADFVQASAAEEQSLVKRLYDARINALKLALNSGKISEAEYNKAVFDAQFNSAQNSINLTISTLQEKINLEVEGSAKRLELQTQLEDAKQALENASVDNTIANEEKKRAAITSTLDTIQNVGNQVFGLIKDNYSNETAELDIEQQRQLELVGDNKAAQDAINKNFARKKAEIARKEAVAEKAAALFTIGLETAKSVVKAHGNPFLIAISLAMGIAQAALVLAKPLPAIPAFAKGTQNAPRGLALVGEAGREIIYKDGKASLINAPSVMDLKGGENILNNRETESIMQSVNKGKAGFDTSDLKQAFQQGNKDIVNAIRNKKELHISASGDRITEREGSYYKTYFNRKIRWAGSKI